MVLHVLEVKHNADHYVHQRQHGHKTQHLPHNHVAFGLVRTLRYAYEKNKNKFMDQTL
jgi:hypothetical protein